jgi:2,3-bisphosphoglycerate-dependent phosphoglycerate mutase
MQRNFSRLLKRSPLLAWIAVVLVLGLNSVAISSNANEGPRVATTVLLVRHAEKGNEPQNDPNLKKPEGENRAKKLAEIAIKADVKVIYTTNANRTRQTVQPLAKALNLQPVIYDSTPWLVRDITTRHKGEVVLVAGHSNTVPDIIKALGGDPRYCPIDDQFNNLCIIVIFDAGKAEVIHLKYGDPSP